MKKPEKSFLPQIHKDPVMFREAVNFTAAQTKFISRLIEKDYFCTVLLDYLAAWDGSLVFKGGTCLAKVHAGFYRLSEDLDFVIPTPVSASRSDRRALSLQLKKAIDQLPTLLDAFRLIEPLKGANNSTQYVAVIGYTSLINRQEETIKIEVGLREPLLTEIISGKAQTILLDPISGDAMMPVVAMPCISLDEAMAEKLRAALSRREAAIRDFFDIDYAIRKLDFSPLASEITELVAEKLAVPGNEPIDVSPYRLETLHRQIESRLKSVLRTSDF
ncbi:MAG: nucleotidyl transferase AbiEii/AbiGii toxin family protein, partial [Syntrophales bacterium]|nr:nucleotidyl transferase AbiEii/AbiGii toxin family protein [Syntrophales bacterium]